MRSLLDINVIIALLDRGHVMHRAARHWMEQELDHGWATCRHMTDSHFLALASFGLSQVITLLRDQFLVDGRWPDLDTSC